MRIYRLKIYLYWGLTAIAVIAASIALVFLMINFQSIKSGFNVLMAILSPIIYGAILAYLLNPIYNRVMSISQSSYQKITKNEKISRSFAKASATSVSLLVLILIVVGLLSMLLPQLIESITIVIETLPNNIRNFSLQLQEILESNPQAEQTILAMYDKAAIALQDWLAKDLVPNMDKIFSGLSSGLISVLIVLKNIFIGVIVMVYLLNIKTTLCAQGKKILYSIFDIRIANGVLEKLRFTNRVFGGFIIGKLLDSLIIGILCFFCISLMNMPYALLISVIIGVTNVIPFFGPFIGAVPSAFLILLISPVQCLYFLIFILLLQQFDGNILGPKILGQSTGLGSFWVLFSILLFGGLFGFVGMIIAVPTFAVIFALLSECVSISLKKKSLSDIEEEYLKLDYIDETTKNFMQKQM